jgi:hypothetical protein
VPLIDRQFGDRQDAFRDRVKNQLVIQYFDSPDKAWVFSRTLAPELGDSTPPHRQRDSS